MISTLVARDGFSLARPFGPVFWGVILNLIGFGMSLVQAMSYFRTAGKDRAIVKFSAVAMMYVSGHKCQINLVTYLFCSSILDIVSSSLIISVFWNDLIIHYGGIQQYMGTNPQIGAECVMSACIAFVAQIYFMTQIYHVKPAGMWGNVVLYTIGALSIIGWVFGLACASVMLLNQMTPHYNLHFEIVFGGSKGANALCDILATIMMCKYLTDSKTGVKSTSNLLDALAKFFMQRGAAVMIIQVFTFIMFFAFENPQYWLAPHLILTKLYVNTFFAILNSRTYLREKHLGTHVSSFVVNTGATGSTAVAGAEKGSFGANSFTAAPMSFAPNNSVAMSTITREVTVKSDDDSEYV